MAHQHCNYCFGHVAMARSGWSSAREPNKFLLSPIGAAG
jgi:hypothetical protein